MGEHHLGTTAREGAERIRRCVWAAPRVPRSSADALLPASPVTAEPLV